MENTTLTLDVVELLTEKKLRDSLEQEILAALKEAYFFVNKNEMFAKQSATAGHVYTYIELRLNKTRSMKFRRKIKSLLISKGIIKPVYSNGISWWKGLVAKDPTDDDTTANRCLKQHYKHRKKYRKKAKESAAKRLIT